MAHSGFRELEDQGMLATRTNLEPYELLAPDSGKLQNESAHRAFPIYGGHAFENVCMPGAGSINLNRLA
jgi:hypothetical protein